MTATCTGNWWEWLCSPIWTGIAGLVALIALTVAVIFGVATILSARQPIEWLNVTPEVHEVSPNRYEVKLSISAVGPQRLFEVDLTLARLGDEVRPLTATAPVLDVGGSALEANFLIDGSPADNWVIIEWFAPTRKGFALGGMRFSLDTDNRATYWWVRWLLPWWPHRFGGRWKVQKAATSRQDIDRSAGPNA